MSLISCRISDIPKASDSAEPGSSAVLICWRSWSMVALVASSWYWWCSTSARSSRRSSLTADSTEKRHCSCRSAVCVTSKSASDATVDNSSRCSRQGPYSEAAWLDRASSFEPSTEMRCITIRSLSSTRSASYGLPTSFALALSTLRRCMTMRSLFSTRSTSLNGARQSRAPRELSNWWTRSLTRLASESATPSLEERSMAVRKATDQMSAP
mmetsp:Transcript_43422/g.114427  ORF Transcript_43422/g.114427 Transcript_43422/m.114427 type:complete len:212 (-) Transcript_43422:2-637(-)